MSSHNGSYTAFGSAATAGTNETAFPQGLLSTSISSLSSTTASRHPNPVSKTYRQSSTLFLTRRLPEALSTLLPLITAPSTADDGEPAPVSSSSRTTRIKVWSLYLTILNATVEMEPEEGKDTFGNQEWRTLCNKVRDGSVWDEVVANGYHGVEGDVDADVVINLATLLLAHARDQNLNQRRLETYLAVCSTPNLDLDGRLNGDSSPGPRSHRYRSPAKAAGGADTPRDLHARVKILELYTLHVLLRNNEWEYSREFISASSVLDVERREAFLQALDSLQEDQQEQDRLEQEERDRQEEELQKEIAEAKRQRAENEEREKRKVEEAARLRREGSEVDYGVEQTTSVSSPSKPRPTKPQTNGASRQPRSSMAKSKGKAVAGPLTVTARASLIFTRLRTIIDQLAISLNSNPVMLMRLLAFVMGFILMLGHRATRERVKRIFGASWGKIKATAGMGTKVSYI